MRALAVTYNNIRLCTLAPLLWTFAGERAAAAEGGYTLQAKPSICVSYDSDQPCTMALELRWQGPVRPQLCVHEVPRTDALQCWQQREQGNMSIDFANTADVTYELQDGIAPATLADANVKVINRDLRSSRKRRRHVWSIL